MDDRLLRRYRNGDPRAGTALKNHLRALAARVLSSPGWGLDGPRRRELEVEAARKGLESKATTMLAFAAEGLSLAAELALRELRHHDGVGHGHVGAEELVAVAMETASPPVGERVEAHLGGCRTCERHLELVRQALKLAASSSVVEPPSHGPLVDQETEDLATEEADADRRARPRRPTSADLRSSRSARAAPADPPPSLASIATPLVLLLALVLAYGWFQSRHDEGATTAWLAAVPAELPPTEQGWRVEGAASQGVEALAAGRCQEAAELLAADAARKPDELWVRYYEGLAWTCARDGPRAREALEAVLYMDGEKPYGLGWWLAVAQLLDGRVDDALAGLDALGRQEHARAKQARDLAAEIRRLAAR